MKTLAAAILLAIAAPATSQDNSSPWNVTVEVDKFSDTRTCLILARGMHDASPYISFRKDAVYLSVTGGGRRYPGTSMDLRVGKNKALYSPGSFFDRYSAEDFLRQIHEDTVILSRYTHWPDSRSLEGEVSTKGLVDAVQQCKREVGFQQPSLAR